MQGRTLFVACNDVNIHQRGRLKRDVYLSAITVQYIE